MRYEVEVGAFSGPLDALLELVEQARAERDAAQQRITEISESLVSALTKLLPPDDKAQAIMQLGEQVAALTAEGDAALAEVAALRAQLATVDEFGADCYQWGLDNKTWRPDFSEWQTWRAQEAL